MTTQDLAVLLSGYPGFLPGFLVSLVVGFALGPRLARSVGGRTALGVGLVVAIGIVLSATMTPGPGGLAGSASGSNSCDLSRFGLATGNQVARPGEVALNIALFVPLGFTIGLLPHHRTRVLAIVAALALPIAIELIQLLLPALGRACQSGDAIDNLSGLGLGVAAALALTWNLAGRTAPGRAVVVTRVAITTGLAIVLLAALAIMARPSVPPPPLESTLPSPVVPPSMTPTPAPGTSTTVSSIPALLEALADPDIEEIVVADGVYRVATAASQGATSLWIDGRYAARTKPVTVRAETAGGVTFDGGGAGSFGGLTFVDGAHHQTWQGFNFANGAATDTGVITFGGYPDLAAPHHIALRDIDILPSVTGRATSATAPGNDHAIYVSLAIDGPHDLLFEDMTIDGRGGLASGFVFYHSDARHRNAWNVTVRRLAVTGTQQGLMLWDPTLENVVFDTVTITDVLTAAVSYESPGATGIVFSNVTSTGSGAGVGFQSSLGSAPDGVTFINDSFQ